MAKSIHCARLVSQNTSELENIQLKFEQIAKSITRLIDYIPKLDQMEVTIDKFSTFDQVCTQAISLDFSCYDWNVPIQSAASETTTKTDWGLNNTRHTKNKSKTITTTTTFERTFQIILESLPKQFRTKKDHIEKLERIIHCLYLQKDKYLTLQEISSKIDMSSVHSTVYLNILHKAGKVCTEISEYHNNRLKLFHKR